MRRRSWGLFGLLVLFGGLCSAAEAQQRQPGDAAEGFAAHFHRDDSTVLVIEDPLPHLKTLLNSPALARLMTDGAVAKLMSPQGGPGLDPAEGWQWVQNNRRWIPAQIAVGLSDAGISDFDHLFRLLAGYELLEATQLGDDDDAALNVERKALRQWIAEELPQIRLPRMRVYVRFRNAEDANALLELVRLQVDDLPKEELPPGVTFENKGNALTARFALRDLLRSQELDAQDLMEGMGLVDANDGVDQLKKAVDAVQNFTAEITLEQVGAGLLLTVGPTTAGGPAGLPRDFTRLPDAVGKPDASTMLWGRWNAARLKAAAAAWLTLHEKWRPSAAYTLAQADPETTELTLETMFDMAIQFRKFADAGYFRAWADDKAPAIRLAMQEEPKPARADLAGSALARMIPGDVDTLSVATDSSLGEAVAGWILEVEGRMASRSLQADLRGKENDASIRLEEAYYEHFASLRQLLVRVGPDRFEPGYAVLFGTEGRVERFEASFELKTRPTRLSGRDLPTPEMAMIGRIKGDTAAMRGHVEQSYSAFVQGMRSMARADALSDKPLPNVAAKAVAVDLGLGVETWSFDGQSLTDASGEAKLRLDVKGDLRPHFFFVDGHVVFSTSPRLSKSVLGARSGKAPRLVLPEEEGNLIAVGRMTGKTGGRSMEHLKAWFLALMDKAGDEADGIAVAFDAAAAIMRTFRQMEWTTVQPTGETREITEGVLLFETERP